MLKRESESDWAMKSLPCRPKRVQILQPHSRLVPLAISEKSLSRPRRALEGGEDGCAICIGVRRV